jgi:hypothetical protein
MPSEWLIAKCMLELRKEETRQHTVETSSLFLTEAKCAILGCLGKYSAAESLCYESRRDDRSYFKIITYIFCRRNVEMTHVEVKLTLLESQGLT